ncbi:hypothetical protein BO99DRAFT_237345 [Aspergillus violaceofuscus CBS 115571]|uniref:Uncharacterized protein n=1 Tax=Aspergillus violaceofuscus (strain CBS 115571) TaxID=1450538 RepID=A0A2V5I8F4_ASPV1|nr:hypothetical protein BO99DRAFT_237345 [Aspergillus violaceofuscus CBS 115571]
MIFHFYGWKLIHVTAYEKHEPSLTNVFHVSSVFIETRTGSDSLGHPAYRPIAQDVRLAGFSKLAPTDSKTFSCTRSNYITYGHFSVEHEHAHSSQILHGHSWFEQGHTKLSSRKTKRQFAYRNPKSLIHYDMLRLAQLQPLVRITNRKHHARTSYWSLGEKPNLVPLHSST